MANKVNTRVVLKNDELSNWLSSTSIDLKKGELAFAKMDNGKYELRIGQDGKYAAGAELQISATQVVGLTNELNDLSTSNYVLTSTVDTLNPQTATADNVLAYLVAQSETQCGKAITADDLHNGDTLIIREKIADKTWNYATKAYEDTVQWQHAAYVYDTNLSKFKAMDGTYNADSVYFDEDIKYTVAIGTLSKPSTYNTLSSKGMSVEDFMKTLMSQENPSDITNPSFTFTTTGTANSAKTLYTNSGEVGTTFTRPAATLKMTSIGSYSNGPASTGVTVPVGDATVSCDGIDGSVKSNTTAMVKDSTLAVDAGTTNAETYTDAAQTWTYKCSAKYSDGVASKTNLLNDDTDHIIESATYSNTISAQYTGFRYMFYGTKTASTMFPANSSGVLTTTDGDGNVTAGRVLTSEEVRTLGLQNNGKKTYSETSTWTIKAGTQQIIFAIPASYNVNGLTVNDVTKPTGKFEIAFNEQEQADVYGATTSTATAKYKVFVATFGIPYAADGKLTVAYK